MTFLAPAILWSLLALPVLYVLLRIIPPPPLREKFGGLVLLQGITPPEAASTRQKTPWWIWLLRGLLLVALIVAFAEPVKQQDAPPIVTTAKGRILIAEDGGWASAVDWPKRQAFLAQFGEDIDMDYVNLSSNTDAPQPWAPDRQKLLDMLQANTFDTVIWLSDGYAYGDDAIIQDIMASTIRVVVVLPEQPASVFGAVTRTSPTMLTVTLHSPPAAEPLTVQAVDQRGRILQTQPIEDPAQITIELPVQLINTVAAIRLSNAQTAGDIALVDQRDQRAVVGLIAPPEQQTTSPLLSDTFYLRQAMQLSQSLIEQPVDTLIAQNVDIILVPGSVVLTQQQVTALRAWVQNQGGWLVRFAGEAMAQEPVLLPVDVRRDTRALGSVLSWETPKTLQSFSPASPFADIRVPADAITVTQQLLAEPASLETADIWATLEDATPLLTSKMLGDGRLVFFHVASDAEWSTLPLSGLFPQMLDTLAQASVENAVFDDTVQTSDTTNEWTLAQVVTARGQLMPAPSNRIINSDAFGVLASQASPPGLYHPLTDDTQLRPRTLVPDGNLPLQAFDIPDTVQTMTLSTQPPVSYKAWFLLAAFVLFLVDVIVSTRARTASAIAICTLAMIATHTQAQAEPAATATTFAYVETGDSSVDRLSQAGLDALGQALTQRTSIEPAPAQRVTLDTDLRVYGLLYWPITPAAPQPTPAQAQRLSDYIAAGGLLVVDTQGRGFDRRLLQDVFADVAMPALYPAPAGHIIYRTYYLLDSLPGRFDAAVPFWVSRPAADATSAVIIGDADWAGAWAQDDLGLALLPISPARQETALRAGINLVMYAYTGTYKQDQIHARTLLDRMGEDAQQ